jgi:predicted O-linked N-acetylglucosamine transferase (SPINDLY family)
MSLAVFAQQPAPVQASWLGYLSTTGLTRIQYRICDRYTDPPGAKALHTETLVRLPDSQWCYRLRSAVDYSRPKMHPFLANGFVTFGSFNHVQKLSGSTRKLWAEILTQVPDARLVAVGVPDGRAREDLLRDFVNAGVDATRIDVVGRVGIDEYFRTINKVDIALDSTPYGGGTTTCDLLWMGVPVITVGGCRPVSRSAVGILSVVGFEEGIASSPEDYVSRAVGFARDGEALALARETLRQEMRTSPMMDEVGFARGMEEAYRRMWRAWCG